MPVVGMEENPKKPLHIFDLPDEILVEIFSYVNEYEKHADGDYLPYSFETQSPVPHVCKKFNSLMEDVALHEKLFLPRAYSDQECINLIKSHSKSIKSIAILNRLTPVHEILEEIIKLPKIRYLKLYHSHSPSDRDILINHVDGKLLAQLIEKCLFLKKIELVNLNMIPDILDALTAMCSKEMIIIKIKRIAYKFPITTSASTFDFEISKLGEITEKSQYSLTKFDVDYYPISSNLIPLISNCKNLTILKISGEKWNKGDLIKLTWKLEFLTSFEISNVQIDTNEILKFLQIPHVSKIRKLGLNCCVYDRNLILNEISIKCPLLIKLSMMAPMYKETFTRGTISNLLSKCKLLEKLILPSFPMEYPLMLHDCGKLTNLKLFKTFLNVKNSPLLTLQEQINQLTSDIHKLRKYFREYLIVKLNNHRVAVVYSPPILKKYHEKSFKNKYRSIRYAYGTVNLKF